MPKVAVISGASSGIGFATARLLREAGYEVYGLSRSRPKEPFSFRHVPCDLTEEAQVRAAVETILAASPHVDVLVNCAGMGISGAVESTTEEDLRRIMEVNLMGTFRLTKALIPALRATPGAKILNVSSVAGVLPIPFQTFYSVTKAGINAYTQALRMELAPLGVQVGAVLPGDTKTGFTAARQKTEEGPDSPYGDRVRRSVERMEKDETQGKDPDTVGKTILRLLGRRNLPVFTAVGFQYKLFLFLNRIFPTRFVTWILYLMYGK